MYYEERIIDGRLMCRTRPDGEWVPVSTVVGEIVNMLLRVTDDTRMEVFSHFCTSCGADDPGCKCWNDD